MMITALQWSINCKGQALPAPEERLFPAAFWPVKKRQKKYHALSVKMDAGTLPKMRVAQLNELKPAATHLFGSKKESNKKGPHTPSVERNGKLPASTPQPVRFAWMQIARALFHQDDDNGVAMVN